MRPSEAVNLVRAHDPARRLALDSNRRDELLQAVLAEPVRVRPVGRRPRRLALALAASTIAVLALAAGSWAVYSSVFQTSSQVRTDFHSESSKIALPPGATWRPPNLDEESLYVGPAAKMYALMQATCAWLGYWDRGYRAGDRPRMRAAASGFAKVRSAMPLHPEGASEDVGGFASASLAVFDRMLREQRHGNARLTRQYLRANC